MILTDFSEQGIISIASKIVSSGTVTVNLQFSGFLTPSKAS